MYVFVYGKQLQDTKVCTGHIMSRVHAQLHTDCWKQLSVVKYNSDQLKNIHSLTSEKEQIDIYLFTDFD